MKFFGCSPIFKMTPVQRRYYISFIVMWLLSSLLMIVSSDLNRAYTPAGILRYLVAVLPALPIICMIIMVGRYLAQEKDEFVRMLVTQSILWGIGITLAVDTTWGFLAGPVGIAPLPQFYNFTLFSAVSLAASALLRRKYQ